MKKRQFLAPLALSLAALLNPASAGATPVATAATPDSQAVASAAQTSDERFVLTRAQQHSAPGSATGHTSHASHASHASHHSHRSHFSSAF
jgi:hypothetical protein